MKRYLPLALALFASLAIVGTVWQTARYSALASDARRIESQQEDWVEENQKLAAGIAVLSDRQRAAAMAASLGLLKVSPERRLRIVLPGKGSGRSDG